MLSAREDAFALEEWLSIRLSDPVNAVLGEDYDQYTSDIWIDDVEDPYIVVSDVETIEPLAPGEPAYASFRVEMMDGMGGQTSDVTWTTTVGPNHTATSGNDFTAGSGTVIAGDSYYNEILVPIVYDGSGEPAESFGITLTSTTGGITILVPTATATISDAPAIPIQPPPPDGQYGPEVGRTLASFAATPGGGVYWEGDEVTFSTTLSAGPPGSNESFVWEYREVAAANSVGGNQPTFQYFDWQPLGGSGASVPIKFTEPMIGQVRVKLLSGDTVSSQTMDVRWKAAHPINFGLIDPAPYIDTDRRMVFTYGWSSSSGRPEDLDGVNFGEFVWMTARGKWLGKFGHEQAYRPPHPFGGPQQGDGKRLAVGAAAGWLKDYHGGGELTAPATNSYKVGQYYWYEVTDGASYPVTVFGQTHFVGDARGEQQIDVERVILYSLKRADQLAYWEYGISKTTVNGTIEGIKSQLIYKADFPWDCNLSGQ